MKDKLEQLVRDNRQAFDDLEPSPEAWNKISRRLHGRNYQWVWKVAAMLFFVSTVGLSFMLTQSDHTGGEEELAGKEFAAVENFYFDMISEKKSLIYDFEEQNVAVDQDFEQNIQKLDAMYQVLKEELRLNPSKQVVDALILNLLIRIDILNEQLQELDKDPTDKQQESQPPKEINA